MGYPPINPIMGDLLMDGTDQTIVTVNGSQVKHYQIKVYYNELLAAPVNETVTIKIFERRLQDNTEVLAFPVETVTASLAHKVFIKYISSKGVRVECKQTIQDTFKRIFVEIHQI